MAASKNATATKLHDDVMNPLNGAITELTGVTSRNVPIAGGALTGVENALVNPIDAAVTGITQSIAGRRRVLGDDDDDDGSQQETPQQLIDDVFTNSGVKDTENAEVAQMQANMAASKNATATKLHDDVMNPLNGAITELTGVTSRNVPIAGGALTGVENALVNPIDAAVTGITQSIAGRRRRSQ